jgi:hypothetical protein
MDLNNITPGPIDWWLADERRRRGRVDWPVAIAWFVGTVGSWALVVLSIIALVSR